MSDRAARIARLSPEQRRLLESKLAERPPSPLDSRIPRLPRTHHGGDGHPPVFPLSPQQRDRLFIPAFLPPGALALRLHGRLDVASLEASLGTICARHEALRTTFDTRDEELVQIVGSPRPVPLTRVDLRELASSAREEEAGRLLAREAQRPFDLSRDLMVRAALVRLGDEEHTLLVVIDHIACDGWSLDLLGRELGALYGTERSGGRGELPEPPIQYADYAVWQLNRLQDGALQASEEYWREQVAGLPDAPAVPADRPPRRRSTAVGAWRDRAVAEPLLEGLRVLSRRHDATLFMTLLTAWLALLHRYSGDDEIVVATPFANRDRADVEESIGFFANPLVLRHDLAGDPTFAELLRRVRETTVEAMSHGDVTLKMAEEPPMPSVQLAFFMGSSSLHTPQLDGLEVERIDFDIDRGEYSPFFSLVVEEGDRGLTTRLYYDPDRFRPARVARMLEHLHALLERIVVDPAQPISTLPPATRPRGQTDWGKVVALLRRRTRRQLRRRR